MIYKKSFKITNLKEWDHEINGAVNLFYDAFSIHPNIMLFNSNMVSRIDILANQKKENIKDPFGEKPDITKFAPIDTFSSDDYSLEICMDEKVPDNYFVLVYDSDPDGDDGEPLPDEDSDISNIIKKVI